MDDEVQPQLLMWGIQLVEDVTIEEELPNLLRIPSLISRPLLTIFRSHSTEAHRPYSLDDED